MLTVIWGTRYKKDLKLLQKRKKDLSLLKKVITMLSEGIELPSKYDDHDLIGELKGYRDCHIQSDWVLIYKIDRKNSVLKLYRTGTHNDVRF